MGIVVRIFHCAVAGLSNVVDMELLSLSDVGSGSFDSLPNSWKIPLSSVKILFNGSGPVILGQGGFGVVYHAIVRQEEAAIKVVKGGTARDQARLLHEITVLERCRTTHIVQFLGYSRTSTSLLLCMEYCQGGTLWASLRRCDEYQWWNR